MRPPRPWPSCRRAMSRSIASWSSSSPAGRPSTMRRQARAVGLPCGDQLQRHAAPKSMEPVPPSAPSERAAARRPRPCRRPRRRPSRARWRRRACVAGPCWTSRPSALASSPSWPAPSGRRRRARAGPRGRPWTRGRGPWRPTPCGGVSFLMALSSSWYWTTPAVPVCSSKNSVSPAFSAICSQSSGEGVQLPSPDGHGVAVDQEDRGLAVVGQAEVDEERVVRRGQRRQARDVVVGLLAPASPNCS